MKITKYFNKNKIGGLILIIVIIIAFGFGGFGGGFMSNNQNNIAKINKTNVTTQDFINFINQSGISQKAIKDNLNNNIIEELLSNLISTTLLDLEIEDFNMMVSESSLLKKIKLNKNFIDENNNFQRLKYEKFLLENNISAPIFEKRLKDRELQKKLFDLIGAGTISPEFLVNKLFETENIKLNLEFINLNILYKKKSEFNNEELVSFINENIDKLNIEYIDFKYAVINPKNLIGVNEFNQAFFNKIDEIESNILNGVDFDQITSDLNLKILKSTNYRYLNNDDDIEKKIYEARNIDFDLFEHDENYIIYKIDSIDFKKPDINDDQIKKEILQLVSEKSKFDYNRKLLEKIKNNNFSNEDFLTLGNQQIQTLTLNSIRDNKKFDINSVQVLYSLPENSFTLIYDENKNVYLAKINNYDNISSLEKDTEEFKSYVSKENTNNRNLILKSYDFLLNSKYKVDINQKAIDSVKNLFQ